MSGLDPRAVPRAELGPEFYADKRQIVAATLNQGSFNLVQLDTMAKVDV